MTESVTTMHVQKVKIRDLYQELLQVPIFATSTEEELEVLGEAEVVEAPAGTEIIHANDETNRIFGSYFPAKCVVKNCSQTGQSCPLESTAPVVLLERSHCSPAVPLTSPARSMKTAASSASAKTLSGS